jgi:hypothetical protein
MSVPTFPDATAQEKFMLMLLERVDGLTDELRDVKKELADAHAQLADSRAQQVAPLPSVTIENCRVHSSRWFMRVYTSSDTPLATEVFARRVLNVLPDACLYIRVHKTGEGNNLLLAYVDAGAYVNLVVAVNAIHNAVYVDHTPVSSNNRIFNNRMDVYRNEHLVRSPRCVHIECLDQMPTSSQADTLVEFIRQPDIRSYCLERQSM